MKFRSFPQSPQANVGTTLKQAMIATAYALSYLSFIII